METFEIYVTYMEWLNGGKNRPVLAFILDENHVEVYQITTQYADKSKAVQNLYFKISDWKQAGLSKQSYVDTGTLITLSLDSFENQQPIGKLTPKDKKRLLNFLKQ
jgi:hypothetical protein